MTEAVHVEMLAPTPGEQVLWVLRLRLQRVPHRLVIP
jgi:hypothetical protein